MCGIAVSRINYGFCVDIELVVTIQNTDRMFHINVCEIFVLLDRYIRVEYIDISDEKMLIYINVCTCYLLCPNLAHLPSPM